ncbi:probable G-protein coupled receptor Mth-like 5 [Eurytemora carolleeae]|uniref:probable G-protein coupled receptor Mth-like 5 n=1 Tax=Eurytemora carolleeae TaxID=1294199 RepID=UPI000C77D8AE|nr:probable G-protein coupled receptor Mth-like 5 [Eurytemora carolleeae]|eukprot:XP_023338498.1 probable G-protein coupled receptor Mth-like 5 [Eurytemora affinis]
MSKSVFTRVTDGQRCCYYSIYVVTTACVLISIAITLHFTVEEEPIPRSQIGYLTLGIFYLPVGLLLLINMYFYWNCTRQIGKQLVYNRSMQHFQVNFDLFSKLLMVLASCCLFQTLGFLDIVALYYIGMVFTILQGPLVFLVSMFRTRVAYLFKKYFCKENSCVCCCGGNGDFIELASTELSTIDKLREKVENDDVEVNKSLLDR